MTLPQDATEEQILEVARSLAPLIRSEAAESERLGRYTETVHEALLAAGLYHLLTPRRYGGLEVSLRTWLRTVIEIASADPGTGWCYCLGHAHNLEAAARWPEAVQDDVFRNPAGYFRASHSLFPSGTAVPVEGGYRVTGRSRYQSGSPFSTHAIVFLTVEGEVDESGAPRTAEALLDASQFTLADDWAGQVLGMRASGSNSVVFDDAFVPEERMQPLTWAGDVAPEGTGAAIHGTPLYVGISQGFLGSELSAIAVGAARAALPEWERIARTRNSPMPPFGPRYLDPLHQKLFGEAVVKTDAAEAIVLQIADTAQRWAEGYTLRGEPLTRSMDTRLNGLNIESGRLAAEAVEMVTRSLGSSEARPGQPVERYTRDIAMYRTHAAVQYDLWMQGIGATVLGVQQSAFDSPTAGSRA